MRKLTVTRQKSFVACFCKTKIYIEDRENCDLEIRGVPCRLLGTLKNGETATFEIGNESAKVFAIAGKSSKEYCNDLYAVSEGEEDITLSGKHKYSPSTGNAFRFDNNERGEAVENRNASKKRGKIILAVALVIGVIAGILIPIVSDAIKSNIPMEIRQGDLTITINKNFSEEEDSEGDTVYVTRKIALGIVEDEKADMGVHANATLKEYARLSQIVNSVDAEIYEKDGLVYFTYISESKKDNYKHFIFAYESDEAFYVVDFWTRENDADKYEEQIFEWAKSVKIDGAGYDL